MGVSWMELPLCCDNYPPKRHCCQSAFGEDSGQLRLAANSAAVTETVKSFRLALMGDASFIVMKVFWFILMKVLWKSLCDGEK